MWNDGIAIFKCRLLLSFCFEGVGNQRKLRNKIKIRSVQSHLSDPNYHHPLLYVKDHDTHANHYKNQEIFLVGKGNLGKYKMGPNALINPTIVREMNLPKTIVREMEKKSQRAILFKKNAHT